MATSTRDLERLPFPPSATKPTWESIKLSRPRILADRVATYAAVLANCGLDESEDALHALAFFDEMVSPPVGPSVEFFRVPNLLNSPDVSEAIIRLRTRGILASVDAPADWVTGIRISKEAFEFRYRLRWSPWGYYLWTFVDGLMANGVIGPGNPRVHVNNTARDLTWVAEELPGYREWLNGDKDPNAYANPQSTLAEITSLEVHRGRSLPQAAWILGRYLCHKTDKRLPSNADFGGRRFLRVVSELTVLEGIAAEGDASMCVFFKDDHCVGELTFGEKYRTMPHSGAKNMKIEDHLLLSFVVEDEFRGAGIGQVMLRHAMTKGVRWVGKELASCLEPLMIRHGKRMPDGAVALEPVHWGSVQPLNS